MTTYIINLHSNDGRDSWWEKHVVFESAMQYKDYLKVPKGQRFSNRKSEFDKFLKIGKGTLQDISLKDRLLIFAHGSEDSLGPYNKPMAKDNAPDLAQDLYNWGLRECGSITFKACFLGKGYFLEFFKDALEQTHHVKLGWVKGYVGTATTWKTLGIIGPPTEFIRHQANPDAASNTDYKSYRVVAYKCADFNDPQVPPLNTQGALIV